MKRFVIECASNYPRHITLRDIIEWLNDEKCEECTLTDAEIRKMGKEIGRCLKEEEMSYGEPYESVYDADIAELCDASTTELHDMYYNLLFGPELQ